MPHTDDYGRIVDNRTEDQLLEDRDRQESDAYLQARQERGLSARDAERFAAMNSGPSMACRLCGVVVVIEPKPKWTASIDNQRFFHIACLGQYKAERAAQ